MAKKTARQRAVKRCDDAFSRYIRARDHYTCYTCGAMASDGVAIQCGHLISRGRGATRWEDENANAQCPSCNLYHEHYPELYTSKWIRDHGFTAYEALVKKSWELRKYSVAEIEEMAVRFDAMTAELSRRDLV